MSTSSSSDGKSDVFDMKKVVDPGSCESFFKVFSLTCWMLIGVGTILSVLGVTGGFLKITLVSSQLITGLCCHSQSYLSTNEYPLSSFVTNSLISWVSPVSMVIGIRVLLVMDEFDDPSNNHNGMGSGR